MGDARDVSLGVFSVLPFEHSDPVVKIVHFLLGLLEAIQVCGRVAILIHYLKHGEFFVDRSGPDNRLPALLANAESAHNVLAVLEVFAALDLHHAGCDDLISKTLLPKSPLGPPVDFGSVENLQVDGIVDFDPLGDVGAVDEGSVVPEALLDIEDPEVETVKQLGVITLFLHN